MVKHIHVSHTTLSLSCTPIDKILTYVSMYSIIKIKRANMCSLAILNKLISLRYSSASVIFCYLKWRVKRFLHVLYSAVFLVSINFNPIHQLTFSIIRCCQCSSFLLPDEGGWWDHLSLHWWPQHGAAPHLYQPLCLQGARQWWPALLLR